MEIEKDLLLSELLKELKHRSIILQIIDKLKEIIYDELGTVENLNSYIAVRNRKVALVVPYSNPRNRICLRIYLREEE